MVQFRAACIQMTAGDDVLANIAHATALIRTAQSQGASLIATPEMTNLMENRSTELREKSALESQSEGVKRFAALAAELQIWLLIGSQAVKIEGEDRLANRSILFTPNGQIAARYDKIHMFDVDLPSGETYRESRNYRPGDQSCLVETALGKIGLSICYDLRFPALYRSYGLAGAQILTVPSAFTKVTGEAHWHVLLRARAIENACFVIAPGQCGTHSRGRQTYGHSLIISPWGEVLADGGIQPGIVLADIDTDLCADARARIPSLTHDRVFTFDGSPANG
jgi:predicted amidohydrolase